MIEFSHQEEKQIALFYAQKLGADVAFNIIESEQVRNSQEARALAKFYWDMVNETVKEKDAGIDNGFGDLDMWLEYICNTFFFYLSNNGYEAEWEAE